MGADGRPSPWRTAEARRTYVGGVLCALGLALTTTLGGEADAGPGLGVRLDPVGLLFLSSALIAGWNFFPKGFRAARRLQLDMNFLMTVAIVGALLIGEPLEAAAIAVLFSFAELLEHSAVVRARNSIDELLRLAPEVASVVSDDGSEETVPASSLRAGQVVRIRPGDKVPIDGIVVSGQSTVNQANVTGESVPVAKKTGDSVFASTLNVDGFLEVEASTNAGETVLDQIARLVRQAQSQRSATEQFVERFARFYTPSVTIAAVLVMALPPLLGAGPFVEWFVRGLTLLVIACPCALVIATPVTIVSAITSGARHGVLIKAGEYVESLGATCAIAFDKTGTLTKGELTVTDLVPVGVAAAEEIVGSLAAVERQSEHPIATAIVEYVDRSFPATQKDREVVGFNAVPGAGIVASLGGHEWVIGTPEHLAQSGCNEVGDGWRATFDSLEEEGKTVVVACRDGRVVALIALSDTLREEAASVLAQLRRLGVHHQALLTGDQVFAAQAVGKAVGVDQIEAALKPDEKVEAVQRLLREHEGVAMLGDGVNDAPALAAATVGIAMGAAGSPATVETADIALMADDLRMLPYARRLSRAARRLVRFNIAVALLLKGILAVGAVTGTVTLMVAVLVGDLGASILVTVNAMRLARLSP